eukprot:9479762-Pyramimonas_sp.AAC.1
MALALGLGVVDRSLPLHLRRLWNVGGGDQRVEQRPFDVPSALRERQQHLHRQHVQSLVVAVDACCALLGGLAVFPLVAAPDL